ncbi:MAG TPA: DUF2207 domain-containing protein [Candidatus Nanopelagicales bacterium]
MASRAGRVVIPVIVGFGILVGLSWPVAGAWLGHAGGDGDSTDPATITAYAATYDVAADGALRVTEDVTVAFPIERHGIFRYWDLADPADSGARYEPAITSVTRDGGREPYELEWDLGHRFRIARVGAADTLLAPGTYTYRITSEIPGAVSPGGTSAAAPWVTTDGAAPAAAGSAFLWSVVAAGWEMPIDRADVVVRLPASAMAVQCATDPWGSPGPCQVTGAGTTTVRASAQGLAPRTGMILRAAMQPAAPPRATLPWSVTWDPVLGRTVPVTVLLLLASFVCLALGWLVARSTREEEPGFPVQYEPPRGLGPVQAVYLDAEEPGPNPLVASVLHMAERGLVRLERPTQRTWRVVGIGDEAQWRQVDPVTWGVAQRLGVLGGADFEADGSAAAGQQLEAVEGAIEPAVEQWSQQSGLMAPSARERTVRGLWMGAAVLAVLLFALPMLVAWAGLSVLVPTLVGLPFAAFVLGAAGLAAPGVGQRHTQAGRLAWARSGGFRRLLSTPSAEDRFDFSAHEGAFIAFIPYAVAFGVADKWAARYRTEMGTDPPVPSWYPVYGGHGMAGFYEGGDLDSFGASVHSSIAAYAAAQAASRSSSGGGGSGGFGGGGGGGGGSW